MNPRKQKPRGKSAAGRSASRKGARPSAALPSQIIPDKFRLNLISNGRIIGQLGILTGWTDWGFCIVVPRGQGSVLSMYYNEGVPYVQLVGDFAFDYYLSVNIANLENEKYAAFFKWEGAAAVDFTHESWLNCCFRDPVSFISQNLSYDSTSGNPSYLYFSSQHTVVNVLPIAA